MMFCDKFTLSTSAYGFAGTVGKMNRAMVHVACFAGTYEVNILIECYIRLHPCKLSDLF